MAQDAGRSMIHHLAPSMPDMKTRSPNRNAFNLAAAILTVAAWSASAELINLHFGSTAYSGTTETSPATPGGPAGTWNNLTNSVLNAADSCESDAATVLLSDGSPGPTLTFDTSSGTSSTTNWNGTSYTFNAVDYTTLGGVYDVTELYESGLVNGGNSTTGIRVKGLTPGNYEVYLVPIFRGSQAAGVKADPGVNISIGLGNDIDARNTGDYTLASTAANPFQNVDTRLTSWVASLDGSTNAYNYIGASVVIDSPNRWLAFLLKDSTNSGPDRPGPSVIQLRRVGEVAAAPRITQIIKSGASVIISGTNGAPNGAYHALRSGTVQSPFASWTRFLTNSFDSSGNFAFTNTSPGSPWFYTIEQQP
jgi:hypothetical protein